MGANQQIHAGRGTEPADQSAAEGFCFAHLSDPHLTSLHEVRWWQLLNKRLLGYLSWRRKRRDQHSGDVLEALLTDLRSICPAHVVITGDLTHVGLPDEFRQARLWLERLGEGHAVTVIPGNHDAYVRTDWEQSWAHWQPYMQSDGAGGQAARAAKDMFPSLRVRDGVALIGLCSGVPTAPFVANGRLGGAQRRRFAQILRETRERGLFRLVLLHHSPRAEDENWRRRLTDGRALCDILSREGAELILHGHGHISAQASIQGAAGDIPVFGIPSASAVGQRVGRGAQYALYRVARADGRWQVQVNVRAWQPAADSFVAHSERQLSLPAMPSTRR